MRIHHLNCGTLRPFSRRRINGNGLPFQFARMVCHCLLIETDRRLVLVDTGFGLDDIAERASLVRSLIARSRRNGQADEAIRLKRKRDLYTRLATRAKFDPNETAARQVVRLGYAVDDVTDIVLTHLDSDHAGGLRDFPTAKVHVHEAEHSAAMSPATPGERFRYWSQHWSHGPDWITYTPTEGPSWFGFEAVWELQDLPEIVLVMLPGHSRGHAGVAVRTGEAEAAGGGRTEWLLHAGDTYFFHGEVDALAPRSTPGLARFQVQLQVDAKARHRSRESVRDLAAQRRDQIEMFCSHDPVEFERFSSRQRSAQATAAAAS